VPADAQIASVVLDGAPVAAEQELTPRGREIRARTTNGPHRLEVVLR
jgi:hypothetical protein